MSKRMAHVTLAHLIEGIGSIAVFVILGNFLGWFDGIKRLPPFDTSPTIHWGSESDMANIFQLSTSLPEDTYQHFDAALQNVLQFCAVATSNEDLAAGHSCQSRNLDGKTVNQVIYLGSKLGDSSLSIDERVALVK